MRKQTRCITVKDNREVRISEVVNDCVNDLCVSTYKGESLGSILRKLCALIQEAGGDTNITQVVSIEAGDNITVTGTGTEEDPYIISSADVSTSASTQFFKFTVGDEGYPVDGYSSYQPSISGTPILINKYIKVYRNGVLQWDGDTTEGITFNISTGTIGFYPSLSTGEQISVYIPDLQPIFPDSIFATTTTTSTTSTTTGTTSTSTTTTTTAAGTVTVYWGWKDTITAFGTESAMIAAANGGGVIISGSSVIADYTPNVVPKYLWMAEKATEPAKTKWDGDGTGSLNQGDIGGTSGTTSNLFASPTIIGTYRFYITEYATQNTDNEIEFKIS